MERIVRYCDFCENEISSANAAYTTSAKHGKCTITVFSRKKRNGKRIRLDICRACLLENLQPEGSHDD